MLCPSARHFILCLVLIQSWKTEICLDTTEKLLTMTKDQNIKNFSIFGSNVCETVKIQMRLLIRLPTFFFLF